VNAFKKGRDSVPNDPQSPILMALYMRKPAEAERLATGARLNIWEAAALGRDERVAELVRDDRSLSNAWSPDGFTPVGLAAFFGHPSTARILIDAGADVGAVARNEMKVQPLHAAAAAKEIEIVRMLLEQGADPNARQQAGYTALMECARGGRDDMVALLLAHGADPALRSDDGKSSSDLALEHGHVAIAELLK
jgi:ankyrin repeat protein